MDTKQTPISVLNTEQLALLGTFMEQDFDLCNFAKAAKIELAHALAFIGNQAILDAIDFIKEFELSRLAHNAARARASTVLLLNRFIHRHDSYDPDHLAENAPVSPHARLVTSAASTLARISDLKSSTKKAPPTPKSTSPSPHSAANSPNADSTSTQPQPDDATNPTDQRPHPNAYQPIDDPGVPNVGITVPTTEAHLLNLHERRSRRH